MDDSICMRFWKRHNYRDRKQVSGYERQGQGELTTKGTTHGDFQIWMVNRIVLYLNCSSGYVLYTAIKAQNCALKSVKFVPVLFRNNQYTSLQTFKVYGMMVYFTYIVK